MNAPARKDDIGATPSPNQFAELRKMLDKLESGQQSPDAANSSDAAHAPTKRNRSRKGPNTMTNATPQPAAAPRPMTNAISFADLLVTAGELGREAGAGKDTQIKFDLKVLEAAYHGTIDLQASKHGKDQSDAVKLAEAYVRAQSGAVIFDSKAPNQRKLVSNVNTCIKLGMWPKGGTGEPLSTVNSMVSLRQSLRKDPANSKKLDDAHNMLMRFARAQLKRDTLITEPELKAYCFKAETEARTAEEVLESIRKIANNLKLGKVANCPDLDNSAEVQSIINSCTKRLIAISKAKGAAQQGGAAAA